MKSKLNQFFSALNQRRCRNETALEFEDEYVEEKEQDVSTQFSQTQQNQPNVLQNNLEKFCNVFPVSVVNSAEYDNNLIKSHLLTLLVNERGFEPTLIRKAEQFVTFKFGDISSLISC